MKKIFTLLTCVVAAFNFFSPLQSFAQKGNAKITGSVIDSVTQKPVEFANIALTAADSSTPIDGAVADDQGKFTISKVAPGSYKLQVTFIGFDTRTINLTIEDKKDDVDLGNIIIAPTPQVLKEVLVEGQKAIIEERVDRTVYNAENDATAKGGDATDVLKRVPMLSVDLEGNVSLRGNQNILVLINNKPSTIMASNVADALKQIPADQIKSVEVITSPSAKYDAEGSAGIINIITKKNTLEGATLNVDSGIGLRGSNLGLNGNFRRGKMGFSLGGWGRANYNVKGRFENEQTAFDDAGNAFSRNIQYADTKNRGLFGNYNLGWDYDINKKNALTASVRFGVRNFDSFQNNLTRESYNGDVLLNSLVGDSESQNGSNNVDANFTYTHSYDKPQRELSVQGLYSRNNGQNNFENLYRTPDERDSYGFKNLNDSYNQEITIQADYVTPIRDNQMFEFGGKNIIRDVFSDFETFQATSPEGDYVLSTGETSNNNLNYDQNVTAGYLSYTYTTKKNYSFKVGSRYEYTTIKAYTETQSEDELPIPSYGILVPSINASKKLKDGNMLRVSYNRRIQRPSIRYLNPNLQWRNDINVTQGNPELHPEYTNNYELSYSTFIKGTMLNVSTFYRNTNDEIQELRSNSVIEERDVILTTYENIGQVNAYGSSIFANVNIGKLSLNGGGDIYYTTLDNRNPDPNLQASNEGVVFSGRIFGSYNLNKGWGFQFFSFYRGKQIQLQGYQTGWYMYSLAIRKEFNEKRGSIGLGVENFLQKSIKMRTELESPALRQSSVNEMYNSSVRLNISYRIGKMNVDQQPRRRRSINNDDLKEGGGDGMNMGGGNEGGGGQQRPDGVGGQRGWQARPQTPAKTELPASTDTVAYQVDGTWNFAIDSPQGGSGIIVLKNDNGAYTGTIKTNRMPKETEIQNVSVKGNDVSFNYPVTFGGNTNTVEIAYRVNNNEIKGSMTFGQFGSFPLAGQRAE